MPTITGVPQVGEALTAGSGNIADADGLPGAFPDDYTFQWVRVDSNETYVGANSSSYTPGFSDVGSTIRVGVSFTDGAGNPEGPLPSEALGPVAPVEVTIESEHDSIGGGLEPLVFTLTREGSTADVLEAAVTIVQDEAWLGASDLTHTVTFVAGDDTTTLTIEADRFSFDPVTSGNLAATVSGTGISGDEDTVEIVSTPDPPITIGYDKPEYSFAENTGRSPPRGGDAQPGLSPGAVVYLRSHLFRRVRIPSPEDHAAVSWQQTFANADFELENGLFVARKPVSGLLASSTAYPVTITDEEDQPVLSLSVAPPSIAEADDGGTMDITENVSTLTVQITNGKTFAENQTVTLAFSGTAVQGTHYEVSPDDADPNTAGHQVVLPEETASVQAIVTAVANTTGDGNLTVVVAADLGGADIGNRSRSSPRRHGHRRGDDAEVGQPRTTTLVLPRACGETPSRACGPQVGRAIGNRFITIVDDDSPTNASEA